MEFIMPNLTASNLISIGIALYLVVLGLAQLFTGKVYGKSFEKYTKESVEKYARPSGILSFLIGAIIILADFINIPAFNDSSRLIFYGIAFATAIIYIIVSITILKKNK